MKSYFFIWFIFVFSLNSFSNFTDTITVSGIVLDKEFKLGNATVNFFNSSSKFKSIKTDINGKFSLELPKNKYRITVKKNNYKSLIGDDFFVDYFFEEKQNLVLNMSNNDILISGKAINKFGEPIIDAQVRVKIKEELINLNTDSNGIFFFQGKIGLTSILVNKEGFYGNGASLLIQNENFINDVSIILEEKTFYISGSIIRGNYYIKDTTIELINALNNKIIATTKTSKDGVFEFRNILSYENAYIRIPKYKYISNKFKMKSDLRQFNLFIE
ncbi:MAG: carboxypeptidase-like regulatory domain-containing protein [Cetobacterium sp.]